MAVIKCKMCGGDLQIVEGNSVCECEYCGSKQTVPTADNEKKMTLFIRANRLLRNCEFDKASGVFETIVGEFPEEAEAYWGLVLCKYGIEYVDDPVTGKKIPTCHRSSFDSVLDDSNFEQACENTDAIARRVYRDEARQIEALRQAILEVSGKEDPYDIFISYKEKDANGERTEDSVIAQDIYKALTEEGYRVFFSRISLESKLGTEYEPYIFAALNSARVMLVVGTDYENFEAVWVKNEWSRFLKLTASGEKKTLIPVFKNMDAYDMPKEFSKFAAQDMGKVGAMQDLLHGVEKLLGKKGRSPEATAVQSDLGMTAMNAQTSAMLKRGYMMLGDGDYAKADDFFERVLNNDAECSQAYWGKALAEAKVPNAEKYGSETLFQKLKAQEKSATVTVEPIQVASLARQADESGLLKDFRDEELNELLWDLDGSPVQYQNALHYYQQQEQIYSNTAALHTLIRNPDFDRAAQYADESFCEAEQTVLKSLRVSITDAMDAEKKKETQARSASENKKTQIINTVKARLSGVKQEQERARKNMESARQEAEKKADAAYREATAKFENDYQLALQAQENDYQRSLSEWQQKKSAYEQNYDNAVKTRKKLEENIAQQQAELRNLTGLFTGRKRKELESNISLLQKKLNQTVVPENPGPKPSRPAVLKKGPAPRKEDFLENIGNSLDEDLREQVKCGLSPFYKQYGKWLATLKTTNLGDKISFGKYPSSSDSKPQPISWRVLAREGSRLLLISSLGLDCKQYCEEDEDVTWEQCSLRKWLNKEFLNTAFTREEQRMIPRARVSADKNPSHDTDPGKATQDQIFLLSISEVNRYFKSDEDRKCIPTEYAVNNGCDVYSSDKTCFWWLRSPGMCPSYAAYVFMSGFVDWRGDGVNVDTIAVRPALWINLDS